MQASSFSVERFPGGDHTSPVANGGEHAGAGHGNVRCLTSHDSLRRDYCPGLSVREGLDLPVAELSIGAFRREACSNYALQLDNEARPESYIAARFECEGAKGRLKGIQSALSPPWRFREYTFLLVAILCLLTQNP